MEINLNDIFSIKTDKDFNEIAIKIFQYQSESNLVYKKFIKALSINSEKINKYEQIPFLPISFFKTQEIICQPKSIQKVFKSSGTTNSVRSNHFVSDLNIYETSFIKTFKTFFGHIKGLHILCLLPSYQEQGDSSLLYMTDKLIEISGSRQSGYFLNQNQNLFDTINNIESLKEPFILFGVGYALLDYLEDFKHQLKYGKIVETGGMKGRRKEITKEQLHKKLSEGFGTQEICSEYGMTELLSQAYSLGNQIFNTPPWMKVLIRDTSDPFNFISSEQTGLINVIDLANVYSCSFIATDDVGLCLGDSSFQVKGRCDHTDIRGCNLLVQ